MHKGKTPLSHLPQTMVKKLINVAIQSPVGSKLLMIALNPTKCKSSNRIWQPLAEPSFSNEVCVLFSWLVILIRVLRSMHSLWF